MDNIPKKTAAAEYPPTAESLLAILRRLRAPGGCPWDREQTRESLGRHLAAECGELLEAIDLKDPAGICDELGDVMMNVLFQVIVGEENHEFDYPAVMRNVIDKMIRRHAHIFGDAKAETSEEVSVLWEKIKEKERAGQPERKSLMDGISGGLSALTRSEKLQKQAAKVGFDWKKQSEIVAKIEEELNELKGAYASGRETEIDEELGDLLFAASNLARFRKRAASEELLRSAARKFERRFRRVEELLEQRRVVWSNATVDLMDELWKQAKREEKQS